MTEETNFADKEQFLKALEENMRWAALAVSLEELSHENKKLVSALKRYNVFSTVTLFSGLLTLPEYQSQAIRLELLIRLALVHCRGTRKPTLGNARTWFRWIGTTRSVLGEDPAEDVFVSLVQYEQFDFHILEGTWENAAFYTQRLLDVVATMPEDGNYKNIRRHIRALLILSNKVCILSDLSRYDLGSDTRHDNLALSDCPPTQRLNSRVTFTKSALDALDIQIADLEPFIFRSSHFQTLWTQFPGRGDIEEKPLLVNTRDDVIVALPTALSIAIRSHVIREMRNDSLVDSFDRALASVYKNLLYDTPLLGGPSRAVVPWQRIDDNRLAIFSIQIDQGYYLCFSVLLPSIRHHDDGGFVQPYFVDERLVEILWTSINKLIHEVSQNTNFTSGLVLLVPCGWGKGLAMPPLNFEDDRWIVDVISVADLIRLSYLRYLSPQILWGALSALKLAERTNVHVQNANGIPNLLGWIQENDGEMIPHTKLPNVEMEPDRPFVIDIPSNLVRNLRVEADTGIDRRTMLDHTGQLHRVQFPSAGQLFRPDSSRRVYCSIADLDNDVLTSVYDGANAIWISVHTPNMSDRRLHYRLWEMANEWLEQLGPAVDKVTRRKRPRQAIKIYLEFHDENMPKNLENQLTSRDFGELCHTESHHEDFARRAIFDKGFLFGANVAENRMERLFVRTLGQAILENLVDHTTLNDARELERRVVRNDDARHLHIFQVQRFLDYVSDSLPDSIVEMDKLHANMILLSLDSRAILHDRGPTVEGKEECNKFLSEVVDVLLNDLKNQLRSFERVSTIVRFVGNSEKAIVDREHFERTSAALLGLHGDNQNTMYGVTTELSKIAGSTRGTRILIEMGLCVCPLNEGKQMSNMELGRMLGQVGVIIRLGELSDAIYYNALKPEIALSPLGGLLFRDELGDLVVEPMLREEVETRYRTRAPYQRKNYEPMTHLASTRENFSEEFWRAWTEEVGFDIDEGRLIIERLEDRGVRDATSILKIRESEYFEIVGGNGITRSVANCFLKQFLLQTRERWESVPRKFNVKDIYPWRFGRRLSFLTRPILQVDNIADPLLVIAPYELRLGFAYVLDGTKSGRLDQSFYRTTRMRNTYWGKASEGHTFNLEVVRLLEEARWCVRANIGLPEICNRKFDRDFGDVDVLAWKKNERQLLVIECKDLFPTLNYSEIAAQLSEYQGVDVEGRPDKLKRHLIRVGMMEEGVSEVRKFTGQNEIEIVSWMVFSRKTPMHYARIRASESTRIGTLGDIVDEYCT